jgi:hypothetical protein
MNIGEIEKDANKTAGEPHSVRYAQVPLSSIRGRIIRNPAYGGPKVSIYGWCWTPQLSAARKPMFKAALRESIKREGIRNPVVLYATEEGDFLSFGGSRVHAARDCELAWIPALVNDYCGRYDDKPEVTPENYEQFFTDVPEYVEFTETGIETHYSLERNRRDQYDPAGMNWAEGESFIAVEFPWIKE